MQQQAPDRFGLLGLLSVIRMQDPDLTTLALGTDLTTLGLNLNSSEYVLAPTPHPHTPHTLSRVATNRKSQVVPDFDIRWIKGGPH